jgi:hypothetical protein
MKREVLIYNRDKLQQKKIKTYNVSFSSIQEQKPKRSRPKTNMGWSEVVVSNGVSDEIENIDWTANKKVSRETLNVNNPIEYKVDSSVEQIINYQQDSQSKKITF